MRHAGRAQRRGEALGDACRIEDGIMPETRAAAAILLAMLVVALPPAARAQPRREVASAAPVGHHERASALRRALEHDALRLLGTRYRRAGASPRSGFDCSGLVKYVFAEAAAIDLPHSTRDLSREGRWVSRRHLRVGDLVFFHTRRARYSHVGIYLGRGRFIHAPRPGSPVQISSLRDAYWSAHYSGARRILGGRRTPDDAAVAVADASRRAARGSIGR